MVAEAFGHTACRFGYAVYAAAIQATHTHVVLGPLIDPIATVVARFKRPSAAAVLGARRCRGVETPKSLWTRSRFVRFLFDEDHVRHAVQYVREHNQRAGLPADPYRWVTPRW